MITRKAFTGKLPSLWHLFATQLMITCIVETLVHFFMPLIIPDSRKVYQGIADALLLSVATAPFVWAIIARPLRAVALSESIRTETVLKSIVEAVICFNAQGQIESLNPTAERMFGWHPEEITGNNLSLVLPQPVGGKRLIPQTEEDGDGVLVDHETIGRRRDGTSFPVLITVSRMNLAGPPLFAAMVHDISERKLAAAALEEQRAFSLKLVQDLAVPCFVLDADHRVLVWNKACEELTGTGAAEVVGTDQQWKGFYDHSRPTLADVVLDGAPHDLYDGLAKTPFGKDGLQCEKWLPGVGGKDRYLFFDAVPVCDGKGEVIAVIETMQDLTERKSAEESLKKSEEKFFKAFHASPDGIVINTKSEGLFIEANEAFVRMLEYSREEIFGHSSAELGLWVDPAERARIIDRTDREGAVRNVEVSIRVKSGRVRTFLWSSDIIELNQMDCLMVTVRDVTGQKESERELLRSKAELICKHDELSALFGEVEFGKKEWEKTMDCINDMVILLDPDGRVKRCNRAAMEFVGVGYDGIIGQQWQRLLELSEISLPPLSEEKSFYCCEVHLKTENRWLSITYYRDSDEGESEQSGAVVTINDITETKQAALELNQAYTELKQTHNQMIQQEKMASIGQLAAGVAHEINNPTGYIISNLGTLGKYQTRLVGFIDAQSEIIGSLDGTEHQKMVELRRQMKIDHVIGDIPDLLSESLDGAERIKNIVQSLKGFSRKDDAECATASITECLESAINIVWNEIKYKATLKKEFGELPAIRCYPQKLSQVFMNLIVNAAHALVEKGEITVRTRLDGNAVYVSVADTGTGIPEEILGRIFEPFFTTKEAGKGTGLGLSISFGIVREHGGEITVESRVGTGTTFTVMLPLNGVQDA